MHDVGEVGASIKYAFLVASFLPMYSAKNLRDSPSSFMRLEKSLIARRYAALYGV